MTTYDNAAPPRPQSDETARLRRIAAGHGLSEDGLVEFVAETRRRARNRRRRLSDSQIEGLVDGLRGPR